MECSLAQNANNHSWHKSTFIYLIVSSFSFLLFSWLSKAIRVDAVEFEYEESIMEHIGTHSPIHSLTQLMVAAVGCSPLKASESFDRESEGEGCAKRKEFLLTSPVGIWERAENRRSQLPAKIRQPH